MSNFLSPSVEQAAPAVSETPKGDQPVKEKSVSGGCLSVIVLGASGDLAKKKTFPAIFNLYKQVQYIYCSYHLRSTTHELTKVVVFLVNRATCVTDRWT